MAELLLVPEVAAGATEVVITEWLIKPGDSFKAGDLVAVIETDKAVVEVEAETDATLLRQLVDVETQIEVGAPMALLGSADEVGADLDALLARLTGSSAVAATPAPPRRDVPGAGASVPISDTAAPGIASAVAAPDAGHAHTGSGPSAGGRLFISPIARKLLREAGVAPEAVTGTGPNGRIIRRDVQSALANPAALDPTATATSTSASGAAADRSNAKQPAVVGSAWTEVPHSRLRRAVANRLTQSKQEIPHFYVKRTAVIDDLLALRQQVNAQSKVKISVNDFILRAVAVAHQEVADANVTWTDEAMRAYDSVDISVAIASERGLVTPVLRGVEKSSLSAVSVAVKDYVEQANAGRLQQKDLEGGSISVTNLGMYGVDEFSAIINPPQSAILAVGAGTPTPRVVDGEVKAVTSINLVLSVDHRAIDGAVAAQWMAALVDTIENPLRLVI